MNDKPAYNFFVYAFNQRRIISGWEFRSDALDHIKELDEIVFGQLKAYSRRTCLKLGVNPTFDDSWGTDMMQNLHLYESRKAN